MEDSVQQTAGHQDGDGNRDRAAEGEGFRDSRDSGYNRSSRWDRDRDHGGHDGNFRGGRGGYRGGGGRWRGGGRRSHQGRGGGGRDTPHWGDRNRHDDNPFITFKNKKRSVSAEGLMAESMAARGDKMVAFDLKKSSATELADWFNEYAPSKVRRSDGVGWIAVLGKTMTDDEQLAFSGKDDGKSEDSAVMKEWKAMVTDETKTVDYNDIKELARKHNILAGKWIFHLAFGPRLDEIWKRLVCEMAYKKDWPECVIGVKISPINDVEVPGGEGSKNSKDGGRTHVVCVINRDFTNEEEVLAVEKALRKLEFKCNLYYKPNIYSNLGIYRNNIYKLRPTIYMSEWQYKLGKAMIDSVLEMGWTYTCKAKKDPEIEAKRQKKNWTKDELQFTKKQLAELSGLASQLQAKLQELREHLIMAETTMSKLEIVNNVDNDAEDNNNNGGGGGQVEIEAVQEEPESPPQEEGLDAEKAIPDAANDPVKEVKEPSPAN